MHISFSHPYFFSCIRGEIFSPEESNILSKCFIMISGDPIVGTNKAHVQFWVRITSKYNKMYEIANNKSTKQQEDGSFKHIECTLDSFKSRWTQKILPAVNKFQDICETNPPTSGELEDDTIMGKYYWRMRDMYAVQAKANTWRDWNGPK